MTDVANRRRNASWKTVREMAVRPVEGRGFHSFDTRGGNEGAALAVTEEWGRASFRGRLPAVGSYLA